MRDDTRGTAVVVTPWRDTTPLTNALLSNSFLFRIYYSIVSGNEDNSFTIDRTTGRILANVSFDREYQDQYHLFIRATNDPDYFHPKEDRKHRDILERDPSITNVRITILDDNDNPPKFEKAEYFAGA